MMQSCRKTEKDTESTALDHRMREQDALEKERIMTHIKVWAPRCEHVELRLEPQGTILPMERDAADPSVFVLPSELPAGQRYFLLPDGAAPVPDPRSRRQPEGIHGPSEIVDPNLFHWRDAQWFAQTESPYPNQSTQLGQPAASDVIYELHVGTFSEHGTFQGATEHFDHLADLGVGTIELLPISPMPGTRGWGYDGVSLMAPYEQYGGPEGLVELVNAAHERGMAVCLDVVFNHFGPDGNYTALFGNYTTSAHHTPWGEALNLDGTGKEHVRAFIIDALEQWVRDYHIDAFRLDAVDWLIDHSHPHILAEISDRLHALGHERGRDITLIAESDANTVAMTSPTAAATLDNPAASNMTASDISATTPVTSVTAAAAAVAPAATGSAKTALSSPDNSGLGMDMQWVDDVHHALHVWLTGERNAYYSEYTDAHALSTTLARGFWHDGVWDEFLGRRRGTPVPPGLDGRRFVVFDENHDQVGNRLLGDRPSAKLSLGQLAVSRSLILLSHFTPMLFMGEEWATRTPFPYFCDHGPEIGATIASGRAQEFATWDLEAAYGTPVPPIPDPQAEQTFASARVDWAELTSPAHQRFFAFVRDLIALRRSDPHFSNTDRSHTQIHIEAEGGWMQRGEGLVVFNKAERDNRVAAPLETRHLALAWGDVHVDTTSVAFAGSGVAIFTRNGTFRRA